MMRQYSHETRGGMESAKKAKPSQPYKKAVLSQKKPGR
jgi:hypothetical protein